MKFKKLTDTKTAITDIFSTKQKAVQTFMCIDVNGFLNIESSSKLLNCTDKEISFTAGKRQIYIHGNGLMVMSYTKNGMTIDGKIEKIEIYEV